MRRSRRFAVVAAIGCLLVCTSIVGVGTIASGPSGVTENEAGGVHPVDPVNSLGLDRLQDGGDPVCPSADTEIPSGVANASEPRIVELYPNPMARGNVGEYLVLYVPESARTKNLSVTDGHATARLPADVPSGRVAATIFPEETRAITTDPVVELDGHLRLAADGDRLELVADDGVVDSIVYGRAPEGERWYRSWNDVHVHDTETDVDRTGQPDGSTVLPARGEWWPRGATCLPVTTHSPVNATAFVLPDSPSVPVEAIESATERISLAGYTFTDGVIADALTEALDRGVSVELLLEAGPVGGMERESAAVLDDIEAAGASVRVLGGEGARYAFHHPKYAVVDDHVLVTTENWKPSGLGGASSRGWGVVVEDGSLASTLETVFETDFSGPDATDWASHRATARFVDGDRSVGSFPEAHAPESVDVDGVELLLAPDNAEGRLLELIESAEESIDVTQVRIDGPEFSLLEAVLDAARDGVEVRILLDDSWYVADENRDLVERLRETAAAEDVPLEARVVESSDSFEKIHTKGVVIDERAVVVGSLNWNDHSFRENREVALVLHGGEVGSYFTTVFEADWEGGSPWPLPVEFVAVVGLGLVVAGVLGYRKVRFDGLGGRERTSTAATGFEPSAASNAVEESFEAPAPPDRSPFGETGPGPSGERGHSNDRPPPVTIVPSPDSSPLKSPESDDRGTS